MGRHWKKGNFMEIGLILLVIIVLVGGFLLVFVIGGYNALVTDPA